MVRFGQTSDYDKLDAMVRSIAEEAGLQLDVVGWTRKTYELYTKVDRLQQPQLVARVESFATTNGEIRIFDDAAEDFAKKLGEQIEKDFEVPEAVILKEHKPI